MMGLEVPQNRGAPSSISVFGLTQESEIGKGFGQSGSKNYYLNYKNKSLHFGLVK